MCLLIRRDLLVATAVEFPLDHLFFVQPSVWSPRTLRCGRSGSDMRAVLVHKLAPKGLVTALKWGLDLVVKCSDTTLPAMT